MKPIVFFSLAALLLWMVMLSPWTAPYTNFWFIMALSVSFLALSALFLQRKKLAENYRFKISYLPIGVVSAFVLYMVFFAGNFAATKLFTFARGQISDIYDLGGQSNPVVVGILILFLIGPGEEIFWRGFIQKGLAERYGALKGYLLAAAIYALVHVWAFNFMLLGAALVCGLSWGFIYMKYRSVWPGIISHALWDLAILILLPIR
jgi:membrane protease YdiL (CAAX protease family)